MNIFVLDNDIEKAAQYHCDKHVVKMITEYAQMLSTTCRFYGIDAGYKSTHVNHPCSKWTRASLSNWKWLRDLCEHVHTQYQKRYGEHKTHAAYTVASNLPEPDMIDIGLTPFAIAMPDHLITDDVVESYRRYYVNEKVNMATWKISVPSWMTDPQYQL